MKIFCLGAWGGGEGLRSAVLKESGLIFFLFRVERSSTLTSDLHSRSFSHLMLFWDFVQLGSTFMYFHSCCRQSLYKLFYGGVCLFVCLLSFKSQI